MYFESDGEDRNEEKDRKTARQKGGRRERREDANRQDKVLKLTARI